MLTQKQLDFIAASRKKKKDAMRNSMSISEVSPLTGSIEGGEEITISGMNFSSGMIVKLGTDIATNLLTVSLTEIRCTSPAHAAGAVSVSIAYGTKTITKGAAFTFVEPEPEG